ncbi:MAG: 3-hydroxy-9,10-secoandrosta-1,3,5(10)-triene-9,17-dione monooxygenase [Gammaproteobacteria bacterium]|jgi:3-hydroxy-9,10-secoandrosta-1,3,5(10)-triene-9,17-dione monooxygenase
MHCANGRMASEPRYIISELDAIAAQAANADLTRTISSEVISSIKATDVMRLSSSPELGGLNESVVCMADELRAVAARCGSTAWCLWNHLCTFHLFCGLLGPDNAEFLRGVTERHEWVCFPAGASSSVTYERAGDEVVFDGSAAFGSGSRYAEWAGVILDQRQDRPETHFVLADLRAPGVRIDPTWEAMSMRASATDHIYYESARAPIDRVVTFPIPSRVAFRDPGRAMINHRYREDWVALSVLWLGAMACGVAEVSLNETCENIRERTAIFGTKMVERPTIHVNLGRARAKLNAAIDTVYAACAETDARINEGVIPTESDYLRQCAAGMEAVLLCEDVMGLVLRVLGGNGLRQGTDFERRYRDFQAMPLHINGHVDRVTEQMGRHSLGLKTLNPI